MNTSLALSQRLPQLLLQPASSFSVRLTALCCCLALATPGQAQPVSDMNFTEAREAFRKGDLPRLELAIMQIGSHPLAVYAENYRLRNLLAKNDASGIPSFLDANEGTYVAEKLRADWLRCLRRRWWCSARPMTAMPSAPSRLPRSITW